MKKRLKAAELFLTVGLVAGLAACGGASEPEADVSVTPDAASEVEGGEGGEG